MASAGVPGAAAPSLRVVHEGAGDGVPLAFSHALGMDLSMWDAMVEHFAPRHPILRYDHRGQGGSGAAAAAYGIDDLVDDAARLIDEWRQGPVVFVGLSMGGVVGQGLAIRHPGLVRGLLLANTAARYPEAARQGLMQRAQAVRSGGMAVIVDATIERFLSAGCRNRQPELVDFVRRTLLRADASGYAAACEAIAGADWLDRLGGIRCPVRVVAGAHDAGSPPEYAARMAVRIAQAQFGVLDAAHLSVLEQTRPFIAEVESLLLACGQLVKVNSAN